MDESGRESGREGGREREGLKRCTVGHTESFIFCVYWIHIFSIIAFNKSWDLKSIIYRCQYTSGTNLAPIMAEMNDYFC